MALAYPGEDSPLQQKIARNYFLAALDDPHFETRIREREPPDLRTAYNTALRLEIQHEAAHAMESDDAKNPSVERRDTPRSGRTPKSSRQRIRGTAGDFCRLAAGSVAEESRADGEAVCLRRRRGAEKD